MLHWQLKQSGFLVSNPILCPAANVPWHTYPNGNLLTAYHDDGDDDDDRDVGHSGPLCNFDVNSTFKYQRHIKNKCLATRSSAPISGRDWSLPFWHSGTLGTNALPSFSEATATVAVALS